MRSAGYAEALTAWFRLQNRNDFDGEVAEYVNFVLKSTSQSRMRSTAPLIEGEPSECVALFQIPICRFVGVYAFGFS